MNEVNQDTKGSETQAGVSPGADLQSFGKVESKTPGRMRVRVKDELRTPENMAKIREQLKSHPDVSQVVINERTGSVAFTHGKSKDGHNILAAIVQETTLLAEVVFEIPADDEKGGDPSAKLDQQLADLMYRVDYAIYEKTGLRTKGRILPGTIAGLGLAQLLAFGISLETLPGPVLIWIGWDIYHRFGKEPPMPARQTAEEGKEAVPATTAPSAA
jgi:hypothetical protein